MNGVSLSELKKRKGPVDISILSLEGDIYVLMADVDGERKRICDHHGQPLSTRSAVLAKALLSGIPFRRAQIELNSPYEEMIGTRH